MPLTSHVSDDGTTVSISISGRFDFNVYQDFRNAYKQVLSPDTQFTIDLSSTEYMDSSALGMLLLLRERAGGDKSNIKITGCNPEIKKIFGISNFDRLFNIS